jgi:hypothetical protein
MKHVAVSLSSAIVVLLAGCPSVPPIPGGPATREIANGVVEHSASGMQFPLTCGGFTRAGIRQYDAGGLDVSAAYNLMSPRTPITVTAYVFPSPALRSIGSPKSVVDEARETLARGEFQRCKNEIMQAHSGAQLASESDIPALATGLDQPGYFAKFAYTEIFAGRAGPVESLLYVYCCVGSVWTIEYRITYPAEVDPGAAVNRFLQEFRSTIREPNRLLQATPDAVPPQAGQEARQP